MSYISTSAKYLLNQVLRVFGMIDIALLDILKALLNAAFALCLKRPTHLLRNSPKKTQVCVRQR